MNELYKYRYSGPVVQYGKIVANHWKAETIAPSEKKARSNFMYQFKVQNNRIQKTKIELPGRIERSIYAGRG